MPERRIRLMKTSSAVVDYLLDEIFEGRLRSGQRIDLVEVAEALDVSRSPVREALVILERDGIVSIRPHRGAFVEEFDADSVMDDFEVLGHLSSLAVARLARRRDPQVIADLKRRVAELEAAGPDRRVEAVFELLRAEHRAGGSGRLRAQIRSFAGYFPWVFRVDSGLSPEAVVRSQAEVVDAIAAGDAERAARVRLEDFRAAGRRVIDDLVRRGVIPDPAGDGAAGAGSTGERSTGEGSTGDTTSSDAGQSTEEGSEE
ncbi:MAG TPA: GntR family transcriptional regulator [Acidimicrobiales bacterium]